MEKDLSEKQVEHGHYSFTSYVSLKRWTSYWYQLKLISSLEPKTVMEIGPGDKVVGEYLKRNLNVNYVSCDIADDLKPDVIGDLKKLPFTDGEFNVVCAFQVLEHIPFEDFDKCLSEMARVSNKHVVLSLPHFGPNLTFLLKVPFLQEMKFSLKLPFSKVHVWDGQHYWEIGKKDTSIARVRECMQKYFTIEKDFIPFENKFHHFFVCRKK